MHDQTYNKTYATSEDSASASAQSDQSSLVACAFWSLRTIQRGINETQNLKIAFINKEHCIEWKWESRFYCYSSWAVMVCITPYAL